jgi:hypothetical protein
MGALPVTFEMRKFMAISSQFMWSSTHDFILPGIFDVYR